MNIKLLHCTVENNVWSILMINHSVVFKLVTMYNYNSFKNLLWNESIFFWKFLNALF